MVHQIDRLIGSGRNTAIRPQPHPIGGDRNFARDTVHTRLKISIAAISGFPDVHSGDAEVGGVNLIRPRAIGVGHCDEMEIAAVQTGADDN